MPFSESLLISCWTELHAIVHVERQKVGKTIFAPKSIEISCECFCCFGCFSTPAQSKLVDLFQPQRRKHFAKIWIQSHHDNAVLPYLVEGKDIHCFDKLCMNLHTHALIVSPEIYQLLQHVRKSRTEPYIVCLIFLRLSYLLLPRATFLKSLTKSLMALEAAGAFWRKIFPLRFSRSDVISVRFLT